MKLTKILYRQHIDRMFKAHWRVQGQRTPIDTKAETVLAAKGIPIFQPQDIISEKKPRINLNIVGIVPKPIARDKTHPNWNENVCFFYRDNNILLEGIDQAKVITKSVEINAELPEILIEKATKPAKAVNNAVLNVIKSSLLFDTQQEKLPKIKDPLRPAFNFPRVLGITNDRANNLLTTKLLQFCESISDKSKVRDRIVLNNTKFVVPYTMSSDNIQLELTADKLILAKKPLDILTMAHTNDIELPNLFPVKHTIAMVPEHIYESKDIYPLKQNALKYHPHTIFVYYDHTKVSNLFEEEVTESQILGRSLMKTFAVSAAYARQKYGNNVKVLPEPITLQCVQTDGRLFHFAVLQLNSLDFDCDQVKNVWFSTPRIQLFQACEYRTGKPVVQGYNPEVIKQLLAFYNNV